MFEPAPPFCHQTSWRSIPGSPTQIEEPVYYFRFGVVNEGITQARLCEVVLENLWIYDSANNPQPYPKFSPVNMVWVGSSNEFININPNQRVFCDIGHISSANYQRKKEQNRFIDLPGYRGNDLRFVLDLRQIFYSQPSCLGPGRYILQVGLYSKTQVIKKNSLISHGLVNDKILMIKCLEK